MGISRRDWLACLGSGAAARALRQTRPGRRPNVILIMSDDQGYGDFACHGNPHVKTPNLDRLAIEGAEFTRFYVSPVCAPTRASLLTGRYHLRCGVHGVTRGFETMRRQEVTLAQALKTTGYRTGLIGKWHLGENYPYAPHGRGFDEFIGFRTGHWIDYWDSRLERNGQKFRTDKYITDLLTDEAIRFVEMNRRGPFFLYLAYNVPHSPHQAPQDTFERYKARGLDDEVASIYAMVENMDSNIGRLLKRVEQLRIADDTIVLFLCDNGANGKRFNAGLRASKGSAYEGGVRSPLFVRWPGRVKPGTIVDRIAAHIDVYPTVLDLCGVTPPKGPKLDGISLAPLLSDPNAEWQDRMLFTHRDGGDVPKLEDLSAVRTQRFNLVNGRELYDVVTDPGEENNIAASHPGVVKRLRAAYESWFADVTRGQTFERVSIPVGYDEENPAMLMATQAFLRGSVHYYGKQGWAHDWLTGFAAPGVAAEWHIDSRKAAVYQIRVKYVGGSGNPVVRVSVGDAHAESRLPAASAVPLKHRDLVPRKETPDMRWNIRILGKLRVGEGRSTIRLETPSGAPDLHVKELLLRRL